nr:hypothetical protein [Micromonospora rifamycinica]
MTYRRRADQDVVSMVSTSNLHGVSTRQVKKLVEQPRIGVVPALPDALPAQPADQCPTSAQPWIVSLRTRLPTRLRLLHSREQEGYIHSSRSIEAYTGERQHDGNKSAVDHRCQKVNAGGVASRHDHRH